MVGFDSNHSLFGTAFLASSVVFGLLATKNVLAAPEAPSVSYEQLIVSGDAVDDRFFIQPLPDGGNALNYLSRAGMVNILEYVVEYPDATGYVVIEKAYGFGSSYLLLVSTGENGASCPATTYAIAFDAKKEVVTGVDEVDGCSENIESFSETNKLIVKKEGGTSIFYNGVVPGAPLTPALKQESNFNMVMNRYGDMVPEGDPSLSESAECWHPESECYEGDSISAPEAEQQRQQYTKPPFDVYTSMPHEMVDQVRYTITLVSKTDNLKVEKIIGNGGRCSYDPILGDLTDFIMGGNNIKKFKERAADGVGYGGEFKTYVRCPRNSRLIDFSVITNHGSWGFEN